MRENNVSGEHLVFHQSTRSVAEAAEAAGVTPQDFVKNICMIDSRRVAHCRDRQGGRSGEHVPGRKAS